ncbi:hypothetical protein [Nocardia paucivorans]|uniref:hypothetical protein n=1 Tax=Nocardia paucivorans TaxID=114259 RepID=UPI0003143F14|nr:hypothetical protein [Nocardia paucivorans]
MAEDVLDFEAEHAAAIASKVDAVADRIRAVLDTMVAEESALWGCWGTGRTGKKFAHGDGDNGYIETSKHNREVIESKIDFLSGDEGYSPEFRMAARILTQVELANSRTIVRSVVV